MFFLLIFIVGIKLVACQYKCEPQFPAGCVCTQIEVKCFKGNLSEVPNFGRSRKSLLSYDLRYNSIKIIESSAFKDFIKLKIL